MKRLATTLLTSAAVALPLLLGSAQSAAAQAAAATAAPTKMPTPTVRRPATAACMALPVDKIGIQLYSLGRLFQPPPANPPPRVPGQPPAPRPPADPAVVDKVLGEVAAIGYKNVETAGNYGMTAAQFKAALDKHGLHAIGSHGNLDPATFDTFLADAVTMKQEFVGSGGFGVPGVLKSLEDTLQTAKNLNAMGQKAAAKGLKLYVHNHTGEFDNKYLYDINKDGKPVMTTAWDIIAAETDKRYVFFEIDVNWAYRAFETMGTGEPGMLAFIKKNADRIPLYHIKEPWGEGRGETDVGQGFLDWPTIYKTGTSVKYFIFEYDGPPDPMKSSKIAFDYMRCNK
jgi:sugar phosphate isomerase/epimerase